MGITRTYLDWSRPALPAAADWLVERYGSGGLTDLSGVVVVLPGRRACRRLLEILVERTNDRVIPPQLVTEGTFPELLYEPQRPFADMLVQHLAWAEAMRQLPRPQAEYVLRDIPDDGDVDGWMALGELLWGLHRELAAELLDFEDVLKQGETITGFPEKRRWEALRVAQQNYLDMLDGYHLWDRQTARIVAVREHECRTDKEIVLLGTADLNRMTRAMIDQVADHVTALIHAPVGLSSHFDEHGCLRPEPWKSARIDLAPEQLRVVDGPQDQADEAVRVLSSFDGHYRADEITVGPADESLVTQIQQRLKQYEVPSRWVVGKTLPNTSMFRLFDAVRACLEADRSQPFANLVRHPDVERWLVESGVPPTWIQNLDDYLIRHLQIKLGFWLGKAEEYAPIKQAHTLVSELLLELRGDPRPLSEWSEPILSLLITVVGENGYDPNVAADRMELEAVGKLRDVLTGHANVPADLQPVVTGAQALQLTLDQLDVETVPPPPDPTAVELLGWLELRFDDAPALVVTSFNEEYIPASVSSDLFLPNRLRQSLGIVDNDRRYARDAYALSAILACRENVTLIAGRRDRRGDPLMPSRLLFACDPQETAGRVKRFFREDSQAPPPLPRFAETTSTDNTRGLEVPKPLPLEAPVDSIRVTAFRSYIACPYRYYLQHVLGLEPVDDRVEEMDARDFGTLLHDVLADFGVSDLKDSTHVEEIKEFVTHRLDVRANMVYGKLRLPAVSVQIEQIRRRLIAFAAWEAERASQGWTIRFVEEPKDGPPVLLPVDEDRHIRLRGRIDRIDQHRESGEWVLLDYKSSDNGKPPDKVHRQQGEWVDLQLPLYRHLAKQLGVEGQVRMGYVVLPRDSGAVAEHIADWSDVDLASADAKVHEVGRQILDGVFWPPTDPPPEYSADYAAICQDDVYERMVPE
ncbi:MAG: PD-(D/E)XK nuclease family protein [Planctomycetaceae bacterium]|nr:PD-(D/E)XK nuclease family protein [Planctomycetaceae bacterium]